MHIMEQRSPMLFDLDSPYMQRLRKMSSTIKDSTEGMTFDLVQKSSDVLKSSLKVPSIKLQRIVSRKGSEHYDDQDRVTHLRSSMLKSEEKRRKIVFNRQRSQPLQKQHPNKNIHAQSSSNNQNVRKRLTSLEKYFEQTRSIQLPFATKNRINQNERFLSQIKEFQMNLSRAKSIHNNNQQSSPNASRNNIDISCKRNNRLSQTRPKPLKIHQLESENVKKEKDRIFIDKIMKEKVKQYCQSMWDQQFIQNEKLIYGKPVPLDNQISLLGHQVDKIQLQLKLLKRQSRQKQQRMKLITDYFAFLN